MERQRAVEMPKEKLKKEDIESKKTVILVFPDKVTKAKTLGLVQEIGFTENEMIANLRPLVIEALFKGDNITIGFRTKNIEKLIERLKQFESSEHEVLVISGRTTSMFSKEEFNRILESMLEKMVTKKYYQALHKKLEKGYVA